MYHPPVLKEKPMQYQGCVGFLHFRVEVLIKMPNAEVLKECVSNFDELSNLLGYKNPNSQTLFCIN
jgi:hypothetical protein